MRWARASVLVTWLGGACVGCSIYGSNLLLAGDGGEDASVTDAAQEIGPTSDAADAGTDVRDDADGGGCQLAHPPPPPAKDDPSDGGDLDLVLAVRTFDLGLRPDGGAPPLLGYDLDGLCTCPGPGDCVAAATGTSNCDDPGGRDNSGGTLLRQFYQLSGGSFFSQDTLNAQVSAGLATMLVRVRQFNGTPNDTQVELSVYVADGTPPAIDAGAPAPPKWNGTDTWIVDSQSVFGGKGPPIVPIFYDTKAYVASGVLVGSINDYLVPLQIDSSDLIEIEMSAGLVTGTLAQSGGTGWSISGGVFDGRVAVGHLLQEFAFVHDPANQGTYLCPSSTSYVDLKALICPALDVTLDPTAPHAQTCDALSLAIGFTAQSAQFGPVQTLPRPTSCPDGGPDHC